MSRIRDVWAPNLDAEMRIIREIIENYPYIAMDTEFPGVVARPIGAFKTSSDYHYQTMRCNVDLLKIIQVGVTLADENGNLPEECSTWQFNFKFNVNDDMYAPEAIEHLQKSGFDFQRHEEIGIMPNDFAELMITSGMCLSFPSLRMTETVLSGYDFGYFVRLLTAESLPVAEDQFFDLLRIWFPTVYDVKFLMRSTKILRGSLQELADDLGIQRIGPTNQAGSDSLLTASTFFKIRELYFNDQINHAEYSGKLYGLGQTFTVSNGLTDASRSGATIAEREDRGSVREAHNQTPGPPPPNGMPMNAMQGGMPTSMPSSVSYGMSANGPYMRTSLVGGR
ncbi:hypothetical protein C0991_003165 [Blastosporella zonata]|nr:hypothetical protein C0991_003165 [Blastosporella zonata]